MAVAHTCAPPLLAFLRHAVRIVRAIEFFLCLQTAEQGNRKTTTRSAGGVQAGAVQKVCPFAKLQPVTAPLSLYYYHYSR